MDRTEQSLKTFVGIKRTSEVLDKLSRNDARRHGLNLNEFAVLELLLHKGDTPIQQIKDRILVASSSTTYLVDKLVAKGLVQRVTDTNDRRVTYASLTEDGRTLIEGIFPHHAELIRQQFGKLTDDELDQLRRLLKKMNGIDEKLI